MGSCTNLLSSSGWRCDGDELRTLQWLPGAFSVMSIFFTLPHNFLHSLDETPPDFIHTVPQGLQFVNIKKPLQTRKFLFLFTAYTLRHLYIYFFLQFTCLDYCFICIYPFLDHFSKASLGPPFSKSLKHLAINGHICL